MKNTKTRIIFLSIALTYNLILGFCLRDFLVRSIVDSVCEFAEPTDDNGTIDADAQPVITSITIRTE